MTDHAHRAPFRSTAWTTVEDALSEFLTAPASPPGDQFFGEGTWTNEGIVVHQQGAEGIHATNKPLFDSVRLKYECPEVETFEQAFRELGARSGRDWASFDLECLRECCEAFRALELPAWVHDAKDRDPETFLVNEKPALFMSADMTWCTPEIVLERVRRMGPIGLDPCSNGRSLVRAAVEWTGPPKVDGLAEPWTIHTEEWHERHKTDVSVAWLHEQTLVQNVRGDGPQGLRKTRRAVLRDSDDLRRMEERSADVRHVGAQERMGARPDDRQDRLIEGVRTEQLPMGHAVRECGAEPPDQSSAAWRAWAFRKAGALVYVNCPYGRGIGQWVAKCALEAMDGAEVVLLVPARPDTAWWHDAVVAHAGGVCFWRGRLAFLGADQGAPFPSAVVYYGKRHNEFHRAFSDAGWMVIW